MPLDERDALFQHFLGLAIDRLDPSLRIRGHKPEHIIFRVHDQSSASPLRYNGFTATSRRFKPIARMSNAIWRERYESLHQDENYRNDEHVLKSIAAHVMGGWPGYIRDQTGPSDWISTTKSLDWAVWEITRRLVKMGRNSVELSLIYRRGYRPGDQGVQHVELDATQAVEALGEQVWLNDDQKCARDFAKASSEVICLGRIFGTDIAENTVWTRASPPPGFGPHDACMEALFLPGVSGIQGSCWIDKLVFSPNLSFARAMIHIERRREEIHIDRRREEIEMQRRRQEIEMQRRREEIRRARYIYHEEESDSSDE